MYIVTCIYLLPVLHPAFFLPDLRDKASRSYEYNKGARDCDSPGLRVRRGHQGGD